MPSINQAGIASHSCRGCGPETGRKAVSAFLAASVLYLGLAQNKAGAGTLPEKDQAEQTELSGAKQLNLATPSYSQMYDNLIKEGTELAANPEKKKEAVEAFMKAIQLYPEKAQKQLSTLDEKTRAVYMEAMQKTSNPSLEEPSTEKKNSKTWLWGLRDSLYFQQIIARWIGSIPRVT